jgi:hypothetical protein
MTTDSGVGQTRWMTRTLRMAAALVLLTIAIPFAPATAGKRPPVTVDAWIVAEDGAMVGQGLTSSTAVDETYQTTALAPCRLVFDIVATPVGGGSTVTFLGGAGSPDFVVQYLSGTGTDVTLKVTGKGYQVRGVPEGQRAHLTMLVQLKSSAAGHAANLAVLAKTSGGRDMVAAFVTGA